MKKEIIVMCGIPCSGKTTYAERYEKALHNRIGEYCEIISRDDIRERLYGKNYKYSGINEKLITKHHNNLLRTKLYDDNISVVIIDNTHCKESYLNEIIRTYGNNYTISIKFMDISLIKAYIRNIKRYFSTGKWVPFKVIKQMYINYGKIDRTKYK